jgi:dTDP-glucose pyrophosphorylase
MLALAGKPMLEHIVDRLREAGMEEILIVVGFRGDTIVDHFRGRLAGIEFAVQEVVEGTAAAVRLGRGFAGDDSFLLTFGDIICDASNYSAIGRCDAAAVIGVKSVDDPWQGAAVYADTAGVVSKIIEKPARGTSSTNWNSAGLYAFAPVVFEEIDKLEKSPRGEYEITSAVEQMIGRGLAVRIFEMLGAWRDVGRPEDLEAASKQI